MNPPSAPTPWDGTARSRPPTGAPASGAGRTSPGFGLAAARAPGPVAGGAPAAGGRASTGRASTGRASTGRASTGGASTGRASTGGAATGGAAMGAGAPAPARPDGPGRRTTLPPPAATPGRAARPATGRTTDPAAPAGGSRARTTARVTDTATGGARAAPGRSATGWASGGTGAAAGGSGTGRGATAAPRGARATTSGARSSAAGAGRVSGDAAAVGRPGAGGTRRAAPAAHPARGVTGGPRTGATGSRPATGAATGGRTAPTHAGRGGVTAARAGRDSALPARADASRTGAVPARSTGPRGGTSRTGAVPARVTGATSARTATAGIPRAGSTRPATTGTPRGGTTTRGGTTARGAGPRSTRTGGPRPPRPPRGPRGRLLRLGDPGRRLGVGFAAVCTLLVILGGRLVQLQGFDGADLAARAEQQRLHPTTIPALRGSIVDRNGKLLAYSVAARTVFADPRHVRDPEATARALAAPLGRSAEWLLPRLTKKDSRYVKLADDVTPRDTAAVLALNLRGIGADDTTERVYPGHDLAAGVVGHSNDEGGLAGIESKFNGQLAGTDGRLEVERDTNGLQIPGGMRQETPAVPGSTVQLTLDQDLQFTAQRALADAVARSRAAGGQVVVQDVRTGEVLAMASVPTYDAQNPRSSDPRARVNSAVQAPVEPGSANKVVTFAAALDRGALRPDTPLLVPDSIRVADRYVHDAWSHPPTKWTATGVLAKSSNVGTLMVADELVGPRRFHDYQQRFGIGTRTGIELPGESPGVLPAPETWSGTTFGNLPIGQGLSMTPLQLAGMYQAIGNDGLRIEPRIVRGVVAPDGTTTPTTAPARVQVVSPQAARTVRGMLEAVVGEGGTAPKAAIAGYRVAGKTGTAQKPNPACRCYSGGGYWATFAGIAPADRPELAISVVIDEAAGGGHGGAVAAPLFREVMSYALTARKVTPTGTPVPTPKLTVD